MGRVRLSRAHAVLLAAVAVLLVYAGDAAAPTHGATDRFSAGRAKLLMAAERGVRAAKDQWWDARAGWYRERLNGNPNLTSIWSVVHLFNTLDALALMDHSRVHIRMLQRFADRMHELYWNPTAGHLPHTRTPVGGYTPLPNQTGNRVHTFYDDNGWLGLAFFQAYKATGTRAYLAHAKAAFDFISRTGWAAGIGGGVWWDSRHASRSSESISSTTLLAALLYEQTHQARYLGTAKRYIAWADKNIWNADAGLYERDPFSPILMSYVQSPFAAAMASLCRSTRANAWCQRSERLAGAALAHFPHKLSHGPQYDSVYLQWALDIYSHDGNPRLYELAYDNAQRALANAGGANSIYLRDWDGTRAPDAAADSIKIDTSTLQLFAWVAAVKPPGY
jgi:uncharacterized protein YyaL (SSP411 family)